MPIRTTTGLQSRKSLCSISRLLSVRGLPPSSPATAASPRSDLRRTAPTSIKWAADCSGFTIPPDSRERTLSTAEDFPVNDFSGIHHVHLPVPRAQGLPGKPAFPRCQVLDGETGNRVGKKRDDAQLPNGGKHRLRARHRCDREVRLFHFLRNFK